MKKPSLKNNLRIAEGIQSSIDVGLDRQFIADVNVINNSIQRTINKMVKDIASSLPVSLNQNSGSKPAYVEHAWKPLDPKYVRRKRHSRHYEKSRILNQEFPSSLQTKSDKIIPTFGGYDSKTAKIRNIQRGRWGKNKPKNATWEFEMFSKVYLRRLNAESLLDKFISPEIRTSKTGKTSVVKASMKFGLSKRGLPTSRYTRKFLFSYILFYQRYVILPKLKAMYPVKIKKG